MAEAVEKIVRVRISGQVQGVGYRAWTVREARTRHLRGWVRNLASGDVEALFAGPAPQVEAMIEACRRGPRFAEVTAVECQPADVSALVGDGFHQLASA